MTATRDDLVDRLLEHCRLPCTTGEERPLADAVERRYRQLGAAVERIDDSVVVGGPGPTPRDRPLVVLAGHLDVVPATDADREPRLDRRGDAEVVVARGASDMKSGNVVAMSLVEDAAVQERSPYDVALVLYAGEEGPAETNQLPRVLAAAPWLADAALAVVLEPTDLEAQLGCLGGLHARLTFRGRAAHSARPWHGENALTRAGELLAELHDRAPEPVEVDGVTYYDVWTATQAWTDGARTVVPDRFVVNLNHRFAPRHGLDEAERDLRGLVGDRAEVEVVDRAPPAPPRGEAPLVRAFVDVVGGGHATGKQAWTDVARLAEAGVPALNFGPGSTEQAHQAGEYVAVDALVEAHRRLRGFLLGET